MEFAKVKGGYALLRVSEDQPGKVVINPAEEITDIICGLRYREGHDFMKFKVTQGIDELFHVEPDSTEFGSKTSPISAVPIADKAIINRQTEGNYIII